VPGAASAVAADAPKLHPNLAGQQACAFVTSFGGEDICGLRLPNGESLGCVHTGAKPHGIAIAPDGSRVFVSNEGANTVSVVDPLRMVVVGTVEVGHEPNQIALTPKGDHLWVTNHADATLSVLNTGSLRVESTLQTGRAPHVLAMNAARNIAVVTSEGDDELDLFDLTSMTRVAQVPVFAFPRVLSLTPDGHTAFLTIRWLNGALVVDLDGKGPRERVALGEPTFATEGKDAHGVAVTHDGKLLILTTQMTDDVTFIDAQSLAVLGRVKVGKNPNWVDITADDHFAAVSTTDDDSVSILDISARKVVAIAHVGHQPKRLVVGACPVNRR
jgi:YVTN family beta-propeller protein